MRRMLVNFASYLLVVLPGIALAAAPCPPPTVQVVGGTSASTSCPSSGSSYTTNFPTAEFPLSEGGRWIQPDDQQTQVRVENIGGVNVAHGTMVQGSATGPYDDSSAYLPAFPGSHTIEAVVWRSPNSQLSANAEIELLLSWRGDGPLRSTQYGNTRSSGYEINLGLNGIYFQLGHFKGALLAALPNGTAPVPQTGDRFKARVVRNVDGSADIWIWWNDVLLPMDAGNPYHDTNPPPSGFPGIGFFVDPGVPNDRFGFTRVTVTSP